MLTHKPKTWRDLAELLAAGEDFLLPIYRKAGHDIDCECSLCHITGLVADALQIAAETDMAERRA